MLERLFQLRAREARACVPKSFPAFATLALMTLTYNIANGLTAGLVLYPIVKVLAGRGRELNGGSITLAALCLTYYVFGLPH